MDYPNNFDIPSFSAGRTVAFSRSVSIWISIVFFLIIAACGFVLLGIHFKQNYPFLISIDPFTDDWSVVTYPNEKKAVSQYQLIQEKLVNDYIKNWFTISGNNEINESRWQECSVDECQNPEQFNPYNFECALSCKSSSKLFDDFSRDVLPEYRARVSQGNEKWTVVSKLFTNEKITINSGHWQFVVEIASNINGPFKVLGFIQIERDISMYPATFGYYVQDFNAYRIPNE